MGFTVITTINAPSRSVLDMVRRGQQENHRTIIVGDRKTPETTWPDGADFMSIAAQAQSKFTLAAELPENHYARKNLGYLSAMSRGADCIFDTDDDNAPLPSWTIRSKKVMARRCLTGGWVNVYRWFTDSHVWPRGLPLEHASHALARPGLSETTAGVVAPIQQGLANGSPDVDAVWRLLMDREVTFAPADSVSLPQGCWSPFNSQSTWWFPEAYSLMYLPSFVSFRMTDIWRSFIAQRCIWALGHELVFHGAEMFQDRNPHNLLRDFEQELPGYLGNDRFRELLDSLVLQQGRDKVSENLRHCYERLISEGLIPAKEMKLVDCWVADLEFATRSASFTKGR
jgi:hypothetical protein